MLEQRYHFPIHILKGFHEGTTGRVYAYGSLSEPFQIRNGVRQGDVIALIATLLNLFLDAVMVKASKNHDGDGVDVLRIWKQN